MHSMHSGYMEKALRHTEKALALIEKIKGNLISLGRVSLLPE